MRTAALCSLIAILTAPSVWGDAGFLDFASPLFLGSGASVVSSDVPMATLLNPAVAADRQRTTLDFSYLPLLQLTPTFLWGGNVLNVGVTWPTPAGVLSGTARFLNANLPAQGEAWGTQGALNVSFAKDLFPDLYVGAGVGLQLGDDWGLGLDLGLIALAGDVGFLKDVRWGAALRNIGRAYNVSGGPLGSPPAFTPAIGASFSLVKTSAVQIALAQDLSFPTFQDVRLNLGLQIGIANTLFLGTTYVFDLRQALGTDPSRSIPFGFELSLNLSDLSPQTQGTAVTEARSTVAVVPLAGGLWTFGPELNLPLGVRDTQPPAITLETGKVQYVSPNHDGVQDDLILPVSITDNRFVEGYRFIISDSAGSAIRTIQNKEDRPENRDFQNIMARLTYVKRGISIPKSLRWDGTSDAGTVVPDGTYHYRVEAWDDNGNLARSPDGTVVVDATPPTVSVSAPYLIFSPDGDGVQDTLPVHQTGSVEDLWTGTLSDIGGKVVRTFTWKGAAPQDFEWDGKAADGESAPDGVYSYHVEAADPAGNRGFADLDNIIIDTRPTPVQLSIDLSYFSPNGDGVKDDVTFTPIVPVSTGVESWTLTVLDAQRTPRRTFAGRLSIPATIVWNGKDDQGKVLQEGTYHATLSVRYTNGHTPSASSPDITIKITPPRAAAKAQYEVFSPGGTRSTVAIYQDTSEELFWTGVISDSRNNDVKTMVWRGRADDQWVWDGRGDDGSPLPDGTYTYTLTATDRAGNTGTSAPVSIRIDTQATPVRLSVDPQYFSPNGDGIKDRARLIPSVRVTTGIDSWNYTVKNAKGVAVRTFAGGARAPDEVSWIGLDDSGQRLPDGQYSATLTVNYVNGNVSMADSGPFYIDTHTPSISVSSDALLFSPTSDSKLPVISIKQSSSVEDLWEGEIRNSAGQRVRGWFWKGNAAPFSWDGKDDNGNLAPDGYYSYFVKAQARGGTTTTAELKGIQIDSRPTPVYVTASSNGFSPNGDGVRDGISFAILATLREGIKSWRLSLLHETQGEQRTFLGTGPIPSSLSWDGKNQAGFKVAPDGLYTALLHVEYFKGNVAEARSTPFRLAVTPPAVDLSIGPLPFSPDNDGVNDELTISLSVNDPVPIDTWTITILDPQSHPFARFSGKGAPSQSIIWNGLSDSGELVQSAEDYPLSFTIRDELGNSTTVSRTIPVDILVVRDGDLLKVRIASITFAADTPDYVNVDPDKAQRNAQTIARLAEIFKKYAKYKIEIQGHANLVNYSDPAKAKVEQEQELIPLSKRRADAIRDALIAQGIDGSRITTVGIGAAEPLVPFSDLDNNWKNRRVEFILVRE